MLIFIVLISAYFELEMWKLQKESVNAELTPCRESPIPHGSGKLIQSES